MLRGPGRESCHKEPLAQSMRMLKGPRPGRRCRGFVFKGQHVYQDCVLSSNGRHQSIRGSILRLKKSLQLHHARTRLHMAYHAQPKHDARRAEPKDVLRAVKQRVAERVRFEYAKARHAAA